MASRLRRGFTAVQRAEMWERWRQGERVCDIARALEIPYMSINYALRCHGGFSPAQRRRAAHCLTLAEREEISRGLVLGWSVREIARQLGRVPSTVSREVQRNGGRRSYRAATADQAAWVRAQRPKPCKLARQPRLRRIVAQRLQCGWSPEQIAGWLPRQYPHDESLRVSHETIYRSLFVQSRGVLQQELLKHLRSGRTLRHGRPVPKERGRIVDPVSIRERPAEAEDRAVPGHWEGDLLVGTQHSFVATLVERHTRYVMLVKLPDKRTETVVAALTGLVQRLPTELRKSLTWDRGGELADHKQFTVATDVQLYFCDPYSPWQRGSNENTNGLLRQYLPKRTDLSVYTQEELDRVARQLNERPRKTLDFQTPAEKLQGCVAATG
ncbi:MAG: IS30 family transposase [Xanthomonadales bacterium]|nr:IS30 family transposase [Xanthomonadales bacterium]